MDATDFVKKLSEKGLENDAKEKEMDEYVKSYEMDLIKKHEAKKKNKKLKTTGAFDIVKGDKDGGADENKDMNGKNDGENYDNENSSSDKKNEDIQDDNELGSDDEMKFWNDQLPEDTTDPENLKVLWETFQKLKEKQEKKVEGLKNQYTELQYQVDTVIKCVGDHQLLWKVKDFSEAISSGKPLVSPVFDSHRNGYKMQMVLSPNKNDDSIMSLHFCILKGKSDPFLPWPFACPITFVVLKLDHVHSKNHELSNDKTRQCNYSKHFDPRVQSFKSPCLQRPTTDRNKNIGFANFVPFSKLQDGFMEEDAIFIKVLIDLSDV